MSADLERRYARLLRLYPAGYHRAELLGTLLESAEEGRRWPSVRESGGLVLGALRARTGRDRRQSMGQSLLVAVRAAALMLIVHDVVSRAVDVAVSLGYGPPLWTPGLLLLSLAATIVGAAAAVAALLGHYRTAITTASAAFVLTVAVTWPMHGPGFTGFWRFPLAIVLLAFLARRRPPAAAGLIRFAPLLPLLLIFADHVPAQLFPAVSGILQRGIMLAVYLFALLWLAVDERVAMAFGLLLLNDFLVFAAMVFQGGIESAAAAVLAVLIAWLTPTVLLLASGVAARRQAEM